jgi:HEAT repeat protein
VPTIVERLAAEPEGRVRFLLTVALGRTRTDAPGARAALARMLGDPDDDVRRAAAGSLGDVGATDAFAALLAVAAAAKETDDVRRAACSSLARLVTGKSDVEAVVALLLELRPRLAADQLRGWCLDLGRAAAADPKGAAAARAREALRELSASADQDLATSAISSLVRIAAAARAAPEPAHLAALRHAVEHWGPLDASFDISDVLHLLQPALEALVELARWPGSGVKSDEVRPVLERTRRDGNWWQREWAETMLRRLPS